MIGSAVAAIVSVGSGVQALSIGVGGIPGILSINPQFWGSFALAMAAAIVIPFVLTWLVGQKKLSAAEKGSAPTPAEEVFIAPIFYLFSYLCKMNHRQHLLQPCCLERWLLIQQDQTILKSS